MSLRAVEELGADHLTFILPPLKISIEDTVGVGHTVSSAGPLQSALPTFCQVPLLHLIFPTPNEFVAEQVKEHSALFSDMYPQSGVDDAIIPSGLPPEALLMPAALVVLGIGHGPTMHPKAVFQMPSAHCSCPTCTKPDEQATGQM
jgi:hypothetical protein